MGMPADHLGGDGLHHIGEGEVTSFLGHARVEDNLQQQVAQFIPQVSQVATLDGVHDFVGFLDRIGGDGGEVLFQIPRTARARGPQGHHDFQKGGEIAGRGHGGASRRWFERATKKAARTSPPLN